MVLSPWFVRIGQLPARWRVLGEPLANYAGIISLASDEQHASRRLCVVRSTVSIRLCGCGNLCFFCPFPENPFAHIGRAFDEFSAFIFAGNQKPNHCDVDQSDFGEIQNLACAAVTHG